MGKGGVVLIIYYYKKFYMDILNTLYNKGFIMIFINLTPHPIKAKTKDGDLLKWLLCPRVLSLIG